MSSILDLTSGSQEDVGYLEMRFRDTFVRYKPDNSCFRISYMLGNSAAGTFITKEFNEIEKRLLGREDGLCEVPFEDLDPFYMPLGYGITSA